MFPVCHFRRERRVTIITMHRGERQLMLTRMPHTCGAPWLAPKNSRPCTKRAARHTIVLISLRRGQHHGDCREAVTHYCVFAALCKCNPPEPRRQRSVWADRCSASETQVFSSSCHVAGLLCRTCSQAMARRSSSTSPTYARAAVKLLYVVTAFVYLEIGHIALLLSCIYLRKRLTLLGLISTPDHLQLQDASKAGLHVPCGST